MINKNKFFLNLDEDFKLKNKILNHKDAIYENLSQTQIEYKFFIFNGGEVSIRINSIIPSDSKVIISNRITNSDDIMKVLLAYDAVKNLGCNDIELYIPYLPYARQDIICNEGESFSAKVFANIINAVCDFKKVYVYDAHSTTSTALINRCVNISNIKEVEEVVKEINSNKLNLVSPDAGANKKSHVVFDKLKCFNKLVKCDKNRNLSNGQIIEFEVYANDLEGCDCLIVDDICDGGMTFIKISEELKKKNCGNLYLFVSHGIFSRGFDELLKHYKCIYTTNSFKDVDYENIKQLKINKLW